MFACLFVCFVSKKLWSLFMYCSFIHLFRLGFKWLCCNFGKFFRTFIIFFINIVIIKWIIDLWEVILTGKKSYVFKKFIATCCWAVILAQFLTARMHWAWINTEGIKRFSKYCFTRGVICWLYLASFTFCCAIECQK